MLTQTHLGFVNLTPHDISIVFTDEFTGNVLTAVIPKSGMLARVQTKEDVLYSYQGIPIVKSSLGEPEFPPIESLLVDPGDGGEPFIPNLLVSRMVLDSMTQDKLDSNGVPLLPHSLAKYCYSPDTGTTAIRDEKGQIKAVRRLLK